MAALSEVADLIMGQSPPSTTYNEISNGLAFFQGKADFGFRNPTPRLFCSAPLKIARPHDILMSVRAPVGPTNIADRECCIGRGLAAIRPRTIDGDFLFFNLRYIEKFIASLGTGSTFHAINKTQLGSLEVNENDFNLPEQRKIAGLLGVVRRAIEQQDRLVQLTAELKKTLLHQLFTHGLHGEPQKQTEIGPVPESWELVPIRRTGKVVTGSTPSTKQPEFYGGDYNLISPADLDAGKYITSAHRKLTKRGFAECRALPKDAVLVGCIGNVGKLGLTADERCATNQQINAIICNEDFNPHFIFYSLQFHRPRLERAAAKVTVPILNKSNFENFQFAVPKKPVQDEIEGMLSILDDEADVLNRKKQSLTDLFRTLLHQLMTAQIRVHDIDLSKLSVEEPVGPAVHW